MSLALEAVVRRKIEKVKTRERVRETDRADGEMAGGGKLHRPLSPYHCSGSTDDCY